MSLRAPSLALAEHDRGLVGSEIPAAGGFGNARSVGRVHSALACGGSVDGVTLMSPETVESVLEVLVDGEDHVMGPLPNERCFFRGGWGGSIAVIDLENEMTASYVMNHMEADRPGDLRGGNILVSAYVALMGGAGA